MNAKEQIATTARASGEDIPYKEMLIRRAIREPAFSNDCLILQLHDSHSALTKSFEFECFSLPINLIYENNSLKLSHEHIANLARVKQIQIPFANYLTLNARLFNSICFCLTSGYLLTLIGK